MYARILFKSLKLRAARLSIAVLAVLLGASLVAALTSLSLDLGGKASRELRAYGANLMVLPKTEDKALGSGGRKSVV